MALRADPECLRSADSTLRYRAIRVTEGADSGKVRPAAPFEREILAPARAGGFLSGHGHTLQRDGGPGVLEISRILRTSVNRDHDLECLLKAQILFWMLAAPDGHAKNFSIRILSRGRFQLTPLYDVLSIWPIIGKASNKISPYNARLAMSVRGKNKHYLIRDIQRRHFNAMAAQCGLGRSAESLITDILAATPAVIASVQKNLPRGFPQRVLDSILNGLSKSAKQLEAMPQK